MLSSRRMTTRLLQFANALTKYQSKRQQRGYDWGNYDASSGACCTLRDPTTKVKSICKYMAGEPNPKPNPCYNYTGRSLDEDYAKHLQEILERARRKDDCTLYKHDLCHYTPSDKSRRYQRTWPDCPLIKLRPKHTCCYEKDCTVPVPKRRRPPQSPPLSLIEKHLFEMAQMCRTMPKSGRRIKRKCVLPKAKSADKCKKDAAPFPSFSECRQSCVPRYCPIECSCKVRPSLCEVWAVFNRNSNAHKRCTKAAVSYCPYRNRSRFLY